MEGGWRGRLNIRMEGRKEGRTDDDRRKGGFGWTG